MPDKAFLQGFFGWILITILCGSLYLVFDTKQYTEVVEPIRQVKSEFKFKLIKGSPTVGDQIRINHACKTAEDLFKLKPFIDNSNLEESRIKYHELILTGEVKCFDANTFALDLVIDVELEALMIQTYIGNNYFIQYWKASFFDNTPAYVWFLVRGKVI